MYYCSGFSRRYIGIENSIPIPMYGGSNLSIIYIGMGQHRLFPMYRQKLPKQNTSEFSNLRQSRCIPINFPRCYLYSLVVYSRANQPQFYFPRIYLHPLEAYPRASRQKNNSYTNFTLSAPKRALRASASALPLTVILRGSSFLSLPSTM